MNADTIYVLEKGKIIETGSHKELLEQKGLYYALWRQQVGERITKVNKPGELDNVLNNDIPEIEGI